MLFSLLAIVTVTVFGQTDPYPPTVKPWDSETHLKGVLRADVVKEFVEDLSNPPKTKIFVGIIGFMNFEDAHLSGGDGVVAVPAINEINASTSILPNHWLVPVIKDDQGSSKNGFFIGMELCGIVWDPTQTSTTYTDCESHWNSVVKKVEVVIGPLYSGVTMNTASMLKYYQIPNISQSATNPLLSDDADYPYMNRICPNDNTQAAALISLCLANGWTKLMIVHSNKSYPKGFAQAVAENAELNGVDVLVATSHESGLLAAELGTQIKLLKAGKGKIIICTSHETDANEVLKAAEKEGMHKSPYMWLFGDGFASDKAAHGSLSTAPFVPLGSTKATEFRAMFTQWKADRIDKMVLIDSGYENMGYDATYSAAYALELLHETSPAYCNGSPLPGSADYVRHACDRYVPQSANPVQYIDPDTNEPIPLGQQLQWFLRNSVLFEGASGPVEFGSTGDPKSSKWSLFNTVGGVRIRVGHINVLSATESSIEIYAGKTIIYPDGSTTPPLSWPITKHEWVTMGATTEALAWVIFGVVACLGGVCVTISMIWREKAILKMSSNHINAVTTLGITLVAFSLTFFTQDEGNYDKAALESGCQARVFLFAAGFSLFFGTIASKLYRVKQIFMRHMSKIKGISDQKLILMTCGFLLLNLSVCAVWFLLDPPVRHITSAQEQETDDPMVNVIEQSGYCGSDLSDIFSAVLFIINLLAVFLGAQWGWETRKVFYPAANDSLQISQITLLLLVVGGFEMALSFMITDTAIVTTFLLAGVFLIAVASIGLIYGPKFYAIMTNTEDAWTERKDEASTVQISMANSRIKELEAKVKELKVQLDAQE